MDRDREYIRTNNWQYALVKLQRMGPNNGSEVWLKLEGNNPAGSVKDRAALSMIVEAEKRGEIKPGEC
ncbi:cysteine synthase B [Escherichia coli]|uniref:cysteine synthase n=1 Tax=Escherichia coli TaxID=562 RepID=A0A377CZK0_ECOLX|nr:cysteine synthase B [Escherichia coli]